MAYFNNDSYYSTLFTPEELGSYPFLQSQTFTSTGEVCNQEASSFASGWTAAPDQSGFMAGPSSIPPAITNHGENLATYFVGLYLTREPLGSLYAAGPCPPPLNGYYLPTISQPAPVYHPGTLGFERFSPSEQGWGTGMPALPIDPGKNHFGHREFET